MYEADELFDTISIRALRKKVISGNKTVKNIGLFFSKSNHLVFTITIAHRVKDLRERLDHIAKDINQLGFIVRSTIEDERPTIKRKAQSHCYILDKNVIGREKEKEEISRMLLADADDKEPISVIAVVGIGGMGKTALAQFVYNAKEVEEYFDLRLWACVNSFSDLHGVLETIVASETKSMLGGLRLIQLQKRLREMIHEKKFLLVLDDVWDDVRERWLALKGLLDAGARGSKIFVTTRSKEVAENLATVRPCYTLEGLSNKHAWSLFKKMAFDYSQEEEIQEKETLGRDIVKKCANVPLAIRTIGSFLFNKNLEEWSVFKNNELMKLVPTDHNMIMQALKISYYDLPPSLKHCFVYCSLFPKDYKFDKRSLIYLWMAQGLLEISTGNQCLEDIGENNFSYLLNRCFLQDLREHDDGTITCKMHDLFHDLATEIAAEEYLIMSNVSDDLKGISPRHMAVGEIKGSLFQAKGMRSLLCIDTTNVVPSIGKALLDGLFLHLTSLRALSLVALDIEEIPSSIGKLVHLRYLDLRENEPLIRLPAALCKLQNLLTLRLGHCSDLKTLPDDLHKLISLRHLETMRCNLLDHMPLGLKEMTSLVNLDRLVVSKDDGGLRCLNILNNLTGAIYMELPRVQWKNCVADAEESMLKSKTKLSSIEISWGYPTEGEETMSEVVADAVLDRLQPPNDICNLKVYNFLGKKIPDWLSSLENLVRLTLSNCSKCLELPPLRQLLRLKSLCLSSMPLLECLEKDIFYESSEPFFPSLELLRIWSMPRLKGWSKLAGEVGNAHPLSFTRLSNLYIRGCPELTCLPLCPFVEKLALHDVNVNLLKQSFSTHQTWSIKGEEIMSEVDADAMLDRLQPPSSINHHKIGNFPGKKIPDWLSSLENLVRLTLSSGRNCVELPPLRQLLRLKSLRLFSMPLLECIENDICYESGGSFFPSLETMSLRDMPRLKGWWKLSGEVGDAHLLSFTRLSTLDIRDCPEVTCLPLCPFVEKFSLHNVNVNLLKQSFSTHQTWSIKDEEIISEVDADAALDRLQPPSSCVKLPYLRHLVRLKTLEVSKMPLLECLENDICYESSWSFFPSLETVCLKDMPRLKGWWKIAGEVGDAHLLSFARLSTLHIINCLELTCLPLCPSVKSLYMDKVNMNLLKQVPRKATKTVELEANNIHVPSSSAHQTYCCQLKKLEIREIKEEALLPEEFKHLCTLRELWIRSCPNLKLHSLFSSLQHLTALEYLECLGIKNSGQINENQEKDGMPMPMPWISLTRLKTLIFEFGSDPQLLMGLHHLTMLESLYICRDVADDNDLQWTAPPNLKKLTLYEMNEVTRLNRVIQQLKKLERLELWTCKEVDELPWEDLKSLRTLYFRSMEMMRSLPDKCQHLPTLESLTVEYCDELESLSIWVSRLKALQITGCPKLREKCKKPSGSYWPLIQHIPDLDVEAGLF